MPEEIFVLIILSIVMGSVLGIAGMIVNLIKHRSEAKTTGSSLTASELQNLIGSAVDQATEPLQARIDEMEARLNAVRQLEARSLPLDLEELPEENKAPIGRIRRPSR